MTKRLIAVVLGLVLARGAAYAQVRPDSARDVLRVGTISVHAARPITTVGGASALEVRLDSLAVGPAASLEQVLRELPLVQVRTNSRGEAQFSLRGSGSDSRQVAVLVDGVPLSLGWDDRADLSVLPATAATSLTLVRGLPSMLHGPNVLGGVVEIGIAEGGAAAAAAPVQEVQAAVEHTGGYAVAAQAGTRVTLGAGVLSFRGGAGFRDRPGLALAGGVDQPDPSVLGTPFRPHDPDLRTNTDLRSVDGFVAGRFAKSGGGWLSLSSSGFAAERGIAAELHSAAPRWWRYPDVSRWVTAMTAGTGDRASLFGGRGDMEATVGIDVGQTDIASYEDATYTRVIDTEAGDDRTLTVRLLADQTLGSRGDLRTAATYADARHDELLSGTAAASYRQRIWSVAGETIWRVDLPWSRLPALRLSIGGAFDGADTPLSGDKPPIGQLTSWGGRVGGTATTSDGTMLLHAGISRRARFPSLRELYSGALGRFEPNPGLGPETLVAAEAGVTARSGSGAEVQVVGFYRSLDDAIEQVTLADRRRQRVNLGEARSAGVEIVGSTRLGPVGVSADATLQQVRLYRDGARLPGHPEYQPSFAGGVHAHSDIGLGLAVGADVRHVGRQYCIDPNTPGGELELAESTRVDLDVAREVRLRRGGAFAAAELRAAVDNAADAAVFDQCGLPQPGRTLRLQVRIR